MLFQLTFNFNDIISYLQQQGVYDVILPFLLIFAIVYGILEKTKIFGSTKKGDKEEAKHNINTIVAFVIAALLIIQTSIVEILNSFLPRVALVIIVALIFLILVGMSSNTSGALKGLPLGIAAILVVVGIIYALGPSIEIPQSVKDIFFSFGIPIIVILLLLFLLFRNTEPHEDGPGLIRALKHLGSDEEGKGLFKK